MSIQKASNQSADSALFYDPNYAMPWLVSCVFKATGITTTKRYIWSNYDSAQDRGVALYLQGTSLFFVHGSDANHVLLEMDDFHVSDQHIGVAVEYVGVVGGVTDASAFRIYKMYPESCGRIDIPATATVSGGGSTASWGGAFYVGSKDGTNGSLSPCAFINLLCHTKQVGSADLTEDAIKLLYLNPKGYIDTQLTGNTYRMPDNSSTANTFSIGDDDSSKSAFLWLFGSQTGDTATTLNNYVGASNQAGMTGVTISAVQSGWDSPSTVTFESQSLFNSAIVTFENDQFHIDGAQQPSLSFSTGQIYAFDFSHASMASETFSLSETPFGTWNGGSVLSENVSVDENELKYIPPPSNPQLYYFSENSQKGHVDVDVINSPFTIALDMAASSGTLPVASAPVDIARKPAGTSDRPWTFCLTMRMPAASSAQNTKNYLFSFLTANDMQTHGYEENGKIVLEYGDVGTSPSENVLIESESSFCPLDTWTGICFTFNGNSENLTNSNAVERFKIHRVDLSSRQVASAAATAVVTGSVSSEIGSGNFCIGSRDTGSDGNFVVASAILTTELASVGHTPTIQLAEMCTDPKQWMSVFKVGNPYRKPLESVDTASFALDDGNSASSCCVWLFGDGPDTSTKIANWTSASQASTQLALSASYSLISLLASPIANLTSTPLADTSISLKVQDLAGLKVFYRDSAYPANALSTSEGRYRFDLSDASLAAYTTRIVDVSGNVVALPNSIVVGTPGASGAYLDLVINYNSLAASASFHLDTAEQAGMGFLPIESTSNVTVSGGKFYIDGNLHPTLSFAAGKRYRFTLHDTSNAGHLFQLSETQDGTHGSGTEYLRGVMKSGAPGAPGSLAYLDIITDNATPVSLHYFCPYHSQMGFTYVPPSMPNSTTHDNMLVSDGSLSSPVAKFNQFGQYQNPLRYDPSIGQPWLLTMVIKVNGVDNSTHGIFSSGTGPLFRIWRYGRNLRIYRQEATSWGSDGIEWQYSSFFDTYNDFFGLVVVYDGGSTGGNSANASQYYSRFKFYTVDLEAGTIANITSSGAWTIHGAGSDGAITENVCIGATSILSTNQPNQAGENEFVSLVASTLKIGETPTAEELILATRDPVRWMHQNKVGNSFRKVFATTTYSNFVRNDHDCAFATKIYLFGDSLHDTNTAVFNEVYKNMSSHNLIVYNLSSFTPTPNSLRTSLGTTLVSPASTPHLNMATLTSGNDYFVQNGNGDSSNPIRYTAGSTHNSWLFSCIIKTDSFATTQAEIISQGNHNNSSTGKLFCYRWGGYLVFMRTDGATISGTNSVYFWINNFFTTYSGFVGLSIFYDGLATGGASYTEAEKLSRFRFYKTDLATGISTDLTSAGTWTMYDQGASSDVDGQLFLGVLSGDGTAFTRPWIGSFVSAVVTTRLNATDVPSLDEISLSVRDPISWLNTYKIGQTFRLTGSSATATFALNDANSAFATQVWLFGDSSEDTNDKVKNYVYDTQSNTRLNLKNSTTAIGDSPVELREQVGQ